MEPEIPTEQSERSIVKKGLWAEAQSNSLQKSLRFSELRGGCWAMEAELGAD